MSDLIRMPATATGAAIGGAGGAAAERPADATSLRPGFQALLERLQKFTAPEVAAPTAAVTTPEDLRDAVRAADSSFTTAMDLRRQLEEAFRRHVP